MKSPRWLATDEVVALHGMQLAAFGGPEGMRDPGLLESALARPKNTFASDDPSPGLARLAAAYAFGIVRNHPFVDGNKRTGLLAAFVFLELNGAEVRASEEDAYEMFMKLAAGKLTEAQLTSWLEANIHS